MKIKETSGTFRLNVSAATNGRLSVDLSKAHVDGNQIPNGYLLLLLDETTREEAWKLYNFITGFTQANDVVNVLLQKACDASLEEVWPIAKQFKADRPLKPRFYYARQNDLQGTKYYLILTNGKQAYEFGAKLDTTTLDLPPNVYADDTHVDYDLDAESYLKAEGCTEEFFSFTKRLMACIDHSSYETGKKTLAAFFRSKAEGYARLEKTEQLTRNNTIKEKLFQRLQTERVVECPLGIFVSKYSDYYYVTADGRVYKLIGPYVRIKNTVTKAINLGETLPDKLLSTETDSEDLDYVASQAGKIHPELILVIKNGSGLQKKR